MKAVKRAGLLSLMSLASVNVWTGSPLMALWVGSRVYTAGASTMAAGERPHEVGGEYRLTALEKVEVWFLFYSGSPIDQRSGRH